MTISYAPLRLGLLCAACLYGGETLAQAAVNPPPSVEISYKVRAKRGFMSLNGVAQTVWRLQEKTFTLQNIARASFFGVLQETGSEGDWADNGLAPTRFTERRFRKDTTVTLLDHAQKKISFSEGAPSLTLRPGTQDRASVIWQIAALARAQPEKFTPNSHWNFVVAGRRDTDQWRFTVQGRETIQTGLGALNALHLVKAPPPSVQEQQVDIWLAPEQEWYPVQIRLREPDGDFVEQVVDKITKK
ncbi:DUF3108 domain-containing protein [Massilia sp. W12]|uniref:DUF3108 domain-containing protein n=1 Tax=Massilia sp. W12 TaxID=3126507 RepID=UPI0030CE97E1